MDDVLLQTLKRGSSKKAKPKNLKEIHIKELHDGKYHVKRHSGKPQEAPMETVANDLDAAHDAMEEHMGGPMQEDEQELGKGQPGTGGEV